jgi:hypothetical protein
MRKHGIPFLPTLWVIVFLAGCASISPSVLRKPFTDKQLEYILSRIQDQDERVFSFYRMGRLLAKDTLWEQEAHILIAGTKQPFRIKIELTHPWGQPIAHILVLRERLEVLSYAEKKIYVSPFPTHALSRFFPGELDDQLLWAAFRGYPALRDHERVASLKAHQISVFDEKEKVVETIHFHSESLQPEKVSLPDAGVSLVFSDFQEEKGIRYAQMVRVSQGRFGRKLTLSQGKVVFNKTIPDQLFVLERPPGFKTVYLD